MFPNLIAGKTKKVLYVIEGSDTYKPTDSHTHELSKIYTVVRYYTFNDEYGLRAVRAFIMILVVPGIV